MLTTDDGNVFCAASCEYSNRPATSHELLNRLFIPVRIASVATDVVVDTGGAYLVLDPEVAEGLIGLDASRALGTSVVEIRGTAVIGHMHRLDVELLGSRGSGLRVSMTALVPHLPPGSAWGLPSIMGWHCCLERIRFAIDPQDELFYFGDCG